MHALLMITYISTATLLLIHEMDSVYWKEWKLFRLPGDVSFFLVLHVPLVAMLFYGLVLLERQHIAGSILSLIFGLSGIFAFGIHTYFLRKGNPEFATRLSRTILRLTLYSSLIQIVITVISLWS